MSRSVARALYYPRSARAECHKYLKRWTKDISTQSYMKYLEECVTSWIFEERMITCCFWGNNRLFRGAVSIARDGKWMEVDERALWFLKSIFMTWSLLFLPLLITKPWRSAEDCYYSFFTWCQSFTVVTSRSYELVSDCLSWIVHCHLQLLFIYKRSVFVQHRLSLLSRYSSLSDLKCYCLFKNRPSI